MSRPLYLEIDPAAAVPIYEQIIDGIQRLVRQGHLAPGAQLPPVRQLAADLEINPNTVARAYHLLERDGILETAGRKGTRVASAAVARSVRSLADRVEDVADRVMQEAASRGIEPDALVKALRRRLGDAGVSSISKGRQS